MDERLLPGGGAYEEAQANSVGLAGGLGARRRLRLLRRAKTLWRDRRKRAVSAAACVLVGAPLFVWAAMLTGLSGPLHSSVDLDAGTVTFDGQVRAIYANEDDDRKVLARLVEDVPINGHRARLLFIVAHRTARNWPFRCVVYVDLNLSGTEQANGRTDSKLDDLLNLFFSDGTFVTFGTVLNEAGARQVASAASRWATAHSTAHDANARAIPSKPLRWEGYAGALTTLNEDSPSNRRYRYYMRQIEAHAQTPATQPAQTPAK